MKHYITHLYTICGYVSMYKIVNMHVLRLCNRITLGYNNRYPLSSEVERETYILLSS